MPIEDGVDRAGSGRSDHGIFLDQFVTNLWGTPTLMTLLNPQNRLLYLEGRFVGMPIRTSGLIFQTTNTDILVAIKNLVAGLTGDAKLPTHHRHFLTIEKLSHKPETFIHSITLFPRHLESSPKCLIV
jgi:hypothetical protein